MVTPKSLAWIDRNSHSFLSESQADVLFRKISKAIDKIYSDDELLYFAYAFEGALVAKLDELRGIWDKKTDEISSLLLNIVRKIDSLQDEGYLYSENYDRGWGGEEFFEGDDLKNHLVDFIRHLPINKKLNFVQELFRLTEQLSYDSAVCHLSKEMQEFFSDSELPKLKQYYVSLIRSGKRYEEEAFYKRLSDVLSDVEKEFILQQTSSSSAELTLILAKFYEEKDRTADAATVLDRFIKNHGTSYDCPEDIFLLRIEFGVKQKESEKKLFSMAKRGLRTHPSSKMLASLLSFLPEYDRQLEELLKEESPHEAFKFYEYNNRLDECVALIKAGRITEWESYPFWCRHKQQFKQEALEAFETRIAKHLEKAKNSAYEAVADTLIQLRQIAPEIAVRRLNEIKTQYSRRRNLIQMLQKL